LSLIGEGIASTFLGHAVDFQGSGQDDFRTISELKVGGKIRPGYKKVTFQPNAVNYKIATEHTEVTEIFS